MRLITTILFLTSFAAFAQYEYEPSEALPFGQPNPDAPSQITDYKAMIGEWVDKTESVVFSTWKINCILKKL